MNFLSIILLVSVSVCSLVFVPMESKAQFQSNKNEQTEVEEGKPEANTGFQFTRDQSDSKEKKKTAVIKSDKASNSSESSEERHNHTSSSNSSKLINAFYVLVSHLLKVPDTSLQYF